MEHARPVKRARRSNSSASTENSDSATPRDILTEKSTSNPNDALSVGHEDGEREDAIDTQTGLESSLPHMSADQEAMDEYETSKAAELEPSDGSNLQERFTNRNWTRGRSSIYVDAFNLALQSVLAEEAHLFDEKELAVFDHWKQLSYESQYL